MFRKILIANRGEIAVRVARTARRLGLRTVAVHSDADRDALHVAVADEAYRIGQGPARDSYLRADAILDAARRSGAEAIHPGYGFLSENPDFAEAVAAAGLVFVGPPAAAIRAMGLKDIAKAAMAAAGVPVVPGYHEGDQDPHRLAAAAGAIGYPVLIKPAAGGGGKGMRRVDAPAEFPAALAAARREAASAFGDERVLIERYLACARHIEIQVFADAHGHVVHLFERDCSLQRRHQKVIEEAPAPGMPGGMRDAMGTAAVRAARAVGYRGAGTVEFIADVADGLRPDRFYFMEMNTRLQVEHPVTEAVTGLDLVEWQFRVAAGEPLPKCQEEIALDGHAVEARLYAEDPARDFLPQAGRLTRLAWAMGEGVRVDAGVREGDIVTPFYDPMLAKLIAHGPTRAEAMRRLGAALADTRVEGCVTNLRFLQALLAQPDVTRGAPDTGLIGRELGALVTPPEPSPEAAALAALLAAGLLDISTDPDPFARLVNFRLWGEARRGIDLVDRGGIRRFETAALPDGSFRVEEDGKTLALSLLAQEGVPAREGVLAGEGETVRISCKGRILRFGIARHEARVTVHTERGPCDFHLAGRDPRGVGEGGADGTLRAAMPGLVRMLYVAPGQVVARGEPLVVTEAMKMETTLTAPRDGRIASVEVEVGDQVAEGAVLIRIGDAEAG